LSIQSQLLSGPRVRFFVADYKLRWFHLSSIKINMIAYPIEKIQNHIHMIVSLTSANFLN